MAYRNISVILTGNASNLRGQMLLAARSVDSFTASVGKANASANLAGKMMAVGLKVAALAIIVGLAAASKSALEFERAMRNVNSISRISETQLKALSQQVLELSKNVPQSALTLAKGLYDIASSGFKGADGLKVLRESAVAASAGLSTTDVAAKAIISVLNAYGLGAESAAHVSDVLFKTVEVGVVTFEELAGSMGQIVSMASIAGISIEQVGTAIAALTRTGLSAEQSTTALARLFQSFITPSAALAGEMAKLHLNMASLRDPSVGLSGVIQQLTADAHGNIETLRAWFPNIRAFKAAAGLMTAEGRTYSQVIQEMGTANTMAGATQRAFNEQMKSAAAQFTLFRNRVEVAGIAVGTKLLPVMVSFLRFLEGAGPGMASAFQAAVPYLNTLKQIGIDLIDIARHLSADFAPLAAVLGGAALAAMMVFAKALEGVTRFLADNETAARALAILMSGLFVSSMLAAGASFMRYMSATRTGAVAASAIDLVSESLKRMIGVWALTTQLNMASGMSGLAAGMRAAGSGVAMFAAGAGGAMAFLTGELYTQVSAWNSAKKAGADYAKDVLANMKPGDFNSMTASLKQMNDELANQQSIHSSQKNLFGGFRAFLDLTIPFQNMGNTLVDSKRKIDGMSPAADKLAGDLAKLNLVSMALGKSNQWTAAAMDKLKLNFDTTNYGDVTSQLRDLVAAADAGSPSLDALASAFSVVSDETSNGTEVMKAYQEGIDGLVTSQLNAFDATSNWAQSLRDVDSVLRATKTGSLDPYTDAGQKNRDVLSTAAANALKRAKAEAIAKESISAGNIALQGEVEALRAVATHAGISEDAFNGFLEEVGLTPDNLRILVEMEGTDKAKAALAETKNKIEEVGALKATPSVTLETDAFYAEMAKVQASLTAAQRNTAIDLFANNSNPKFSKHADGGFVPGTGSGDTVPAMLTPGEFVIRKAAAEFLGDGTLHRLNNIDRYATGGKVKHKRVPAGPAGEIADWPGIVSLGNIDLQHRPKVKNKDGSVSTVRSASMSTDQGEVLFPTVLDGPPRVVPTDEAYAYSRKTAKMLGIFNNPTNATSYAQYLHRKQAEFYSVPGKAGGGLVGPYTYLVGEKGPELVTFSGVGQVFPAHDARSRSAAGGGTLYPGAADGTTFGQRAGQASADAAATAARVVAGRSAEQDKSAESAKKEADATKKLNEEIAKNRQERAMAAATLSDRLAMLDRLIPKEVAYTDKWVQLVEQREATEKQIKEDRQKREKDLSDFLQATFNARVEAAKNAYAAGRVTSEDYIKLLKEQHAQAVQAHGYWSDEATNIRTEITATGGAALDEERRIEDARYKLGETSTADRLATLQKRLQAEKQYSEEWISIQDEINSILKDEADAQKRALDAVVGSVADVYVNAKKAFRDQQEAYKQAVESARSQIVGDLSNVYEAAKQRFDQQSADLQKSIEERANSIRDGIVQTFGGSQKTTGTELSAYLDHQIEAARQWQDEMKKIASSGLDPALIKRMKAAGPSALALAKALNSLDATQVNTAMQQLQQINGVTDGLWSDPQDAMLSFNDILADETQKWVQVNADRDAAKTWAESMANTYMPAVNFHWKTFDELLQEEIIAQRDAMVERNEALAWAGGMVEQMGGVNGALRDMIELLKTLNATPIPTIPTTAADQAKRDNYDPLFNNPGSGGGNGGDAFHQAYVASNEATQRYLWAIGHPNGQAFPGVQSYDSGGYLPTGYSMAYNGTGRPEPVGHDLKGNNVTMSANVSVTVGSGADLAEARRAVSGGVSDAFKDVVRIMNQGARK